MTDHSLSMWDQRVQRSNRAATTLLGLAGATIIALAAALLAPRPMPGMQMSDTMQMSSASDAPIAVTTISKEKLAHVPGKEITVQLLVFKPGALAPEHHHAGSVTVYVLSGTIRSELAGEPAMDYHAGQSFFEPVGTTHMFAQNPSATEEAKVIAIHVADQGAQLTTYH